jgi:RHS repeat-associated protein
VSSVSTNMGSGNPALNVAYKDVITRGLVFVSGTSSSTSLDSAYSMFDGPRTDVVDVSKFWVDSLGSPTRVRDALGHETKVIYGAFWPGVATETRDALDFSHKATFDATTGLLLTLSDSNAFGDGLTRSTSYRWNTTWRQPTSIVQPLGDSVSFSYDASGNRQWQEPGSDATRRVTFAYNGLGQVTSVQTPITPASGISYDALGNVSTTTSSAGWITTHNRDSYGRDTTVLSPIDASHSQRARNVYDNMSRAWHTTTYGPAMNGANADSMTVEKTYDQEGNVQYLDRVFVANAMLSRLREISSYDAIGRVTQHVNDQGYAKTFTLDPAGNATQTVTERGLTINAKFDAANRLQFEYLPTVAYSSNACAWSPCYYRLPNRDTSVTILADTVMNLYDPAGHLVFAGNMAARVRRYYTPGGYLSSEAQSLATNLTMQGDGTGSEAGPLQTFNFPSDWNNGCQDPSSCGSGQLKTFGPVITLSSGTSTSNTANSSTSTTTKRAAKTSKPSAGGGGGTVTPSDATAPGSFDDNFQYDNYTIGYQYDLDGRLKKVLHPTNLAPCTNCTPAQQYAYDPITGDLTSVTDVLGNVHSVGYDTKGRMTQTTSPAWTVTHGYDNDDNTTSYNTPWVNTSMTVDALGRMVTANVNGQVGTSSYDGMGRAIQTQYLSPDAGIEQFSYDVIGNRVSSHRFLSDPQNPDNGIRNFTVSLTGQVSQITSDPGNQNNFYSQENYEYDNTGNTIHEYGNERRQVSPTYNHYWESRSYYGPDEKLRVYSRFAGIGPNSDPTMAGHRAVYEETWYDALGRRVMVRSRRDANCSNVSPFPDECVSAMQRYVWDGDQVLYEIRTDGSDSTSWGAMRGDAPSTLRSLPYSAYGIIGYTHVTGIDLPSLIFKETTQNVLSQALVPHANWRAEFDSANVVSGTTPNVRWPGKSETLDAAPTTTNTPLYDWFGDLSGGNTTGSGQKYMRNRYYDPSTGKFTQRDPAGLAGGLNLYGYAGGDAVNYSDPFGLCTIGKDCLAAVKKLLDNLASSPVFQSINVGLFAASTAMASGYEDPNMARMAFRAQSEAESEALGAEGAAMRSGPVPSDHVVVRGGESPVPPAGETFSGAAGKDLLEAAAAIPHGKLRQTTAGDITAGGGTVEWKPERTRSGVMNYNHVNVCLGTGACPFGPVQPNPVPKNQRIQ